MQFGKYLGKQQMPFQGLHILCIILFIVVAYHGFEYAHWGNIGKLAEKLFYAWFMFCFVSMQTKRYECNFRGLVLFLMLVPLLSMGNTYLMYGQSLVRSFIVSMSTFTWMIYFLLHKYKVSESSVFRALLYISLFILAVQLVQQVTYPDIYFGGRSDDIMLENNYNENAEMRNGIWRFRMHNNAYYTAPVLFATWYWVRKKFDIRLMCIVFFLLISVYLTLTRQVMVACAFTMFFSLFTQVNNKHKMRTLLVALFLIIGLCASYEMLFSELAEKTSEEKTDDNIRVLAALYFFDESIQNPIVFLFGHGAAARGSAYEKYILDLRDLGFYISDVGFIGQIFERGFIFVFYFYLLVYKLFFKCKKVIPLYIRMSVLFMTMMSPMIFPIIGSSTIVVWALLLYICDLHINKSPLALPYTTNVTQ